MTTGYSGLRNLRVSGANGVSYAYRDTGGADTGGADTGAADGVPLVLLQHFRGNLDDWDPALIDALGRDRRVVTFDNTGVGGSTGTTPGTVAQMARDAIEFLTGLDFSQVDLLGFSLGSFVAQEIALVRPALVRRLILVSSAPKGAPGMHGWAPEVIGNGIGKPQPDADGYLSVFFTDSPESSSAGRQLLQRKFARTTDRDATDELAGAPGPVRRRVYVGHPRPCLAGTARGSGPPGVRLR